MAEPNLILASTGAALVTLTTYAIGSILGEYSIILVLGFLGTIIALSEQESKSWKESFLFMFRGITFSLVFTGLITTIFLKYIPADYGLTPYALLGAVSFIIGWTSNKWGKIKEAIILAASKKIDKT